MKHKPLRSLNARLLIASLLCLLIFLGLTGLVLNRAFYNSSETGLEQRMESQLYLLLGAAELDNGQISVSGNLADPRFNQVDSGIYGLIKDSDGRTLWRSPSAVSLADIALSPVNAGQYQFGFFSDNEQQQLYLYRLRIIWEQGDDREMPLDFVILLDAASTLAERQQFSRTLWLWFSVIGLVLLSCLTLILRWGLTPLRQLANDLSAIEAGNKQRLEGDYPTELTPLTRNLNRLLEHEQDQRTRYQHTLADLAHSLKTPLAVVRSTLDQNIEHAELISLQEQINRMDDIIRYQLNRASANSTSLSLARVAVKPELEKLLRTLNKVYIDKALEVELHCPPQAEFRGDAGDFLELMGNLLDNAYKAAHHRIDVNVITGTGSESGLTIDIEDDGPGIAEADREQVVQRGIRADSRQSGQGIGLAVAAEIVAAYRGHLKITRSQRLGGACISLILGAEP